jgi:malate dehydrogenase (oxaloacetate-decarboxylating)
MKRETSQTRVEALIAKAQKPARESMRLHPYYRGKIQVVPKCPVRGFDDFAIWYTPGGRPPARKSSEIPIPSTASPTRETSSPS